MSFQQYVKDHLVIENESVDDSTLVYVAFEQVTGGVYRANFFKVPSDYAPQQSHIPNSMWAGSKPVHGLIDLERCLSMADTIVNGYSDIPTFGGPNPRQAGEFHDPDQIWSWDETNILAGDDMYSLEIVPRTSS